MKPDANGLLPAVIQDADSGAILMLGYMDRQALLLTQESGQVHFYSRSRRALWHKGATSGHFLHVVALTADCDRDAVLVRARPAGPTCHTGQSSCFHLAVDDWPAEAPQSLGGALEGLAAVVAERQASRPVGSYTSYLFDQGVDKIGKKIGEEATELVIALKNGQPEAIAEEAGDLLFHLLVALQASSVTPAAVAGILAARAGKASKLPGAARPAD